MIKSYHTAIAAFLTPYVFYFFTPEDADQMLEIINFALATLLFGVFVIATIEPGLREKINKEIGKNESNNT